MCAGGLQLLDPVYAAILIQLLQQMPLAPMTCGSMPAMYMGTMNGAVPAQYAAYNGSEDKASHHHHADVYQHMFTMLECSRVQGACDNGVGTGPGDIKSNLQALWFAPAGNQATSLSDSTPHRLPIFQSLSCWQ